MVKKAQKRKVYTIYQMVQDRIKNRAGVDVSIESVRSIINARRSQDSPTGQLVMNHYNDLLAETK